ncbi:DUF3592 domain-containing protein [Metapseudomonas otitidis]|uniref:DUF3592 domain-containing protein n=1 Tax=Metapseudomonas otitidis TaxID=319939 RepID=UPI00209B58B8|nr:DUF3592 domain-containing protein [Pseudomonas otitidis]MCO7556766.1 DUF3592 domain-containing protein [Pseudomonas otitidis]
MKIGTFIKAGAWTAALFFGVKEILTLQSWTETSATVTTISYSRHSDSKRLGGGYYTVFIDVAYEVNGTRYTDRSSTDISLASLQTYLKLYKPGTRMKLKYDPKEPWESEVITPGWRG